MDILTSDLKINYFFYKSRNIDMKQEFTVFWSIDEDLRLLICHSILLESNAGMQPE